MQEKLISVIIPCYYSSELIKKAFIMLSKQTRKDLIEVIMINDCSPNTNNDYLDIRNEFSQSLDIQYLKTKKNNGPGFARQIGIDYSNCPWIIFQDDDDSLNNEFVIEHYYNIIKKYEKSNQNLAIVFGQKKLYKNNNEIENISSGLTGNLLNLNFIKKNKIFFNSDLSFEEDTLFLSQFLYYIQKHNILNQDIKYNIESTENFFTYSKYSNDKSICSTLLLNENIKKSQLFLKKFLTFFINEYYNTNNKNIKKIIIESLSSYFEYFYYLIERIQSFNYILDKEDKKNLLSFFLCFNKVLTYKDKKNKKEKYYFCLKFIIQFLFKK